MRVERGEERKREKPQVEEIKKRRPLRNPFGDDDDDDIDDPMSFLRNKLLSKYVMPHNFFFISICSLYSLSIMFIYVSSSLSSLSLSPSIYFSLCHSDYLFLPFSGLQVPVKQVPGRWGRQRHGGQL